MDDRTAVDAPLPPPVFERRLHDQCLKGAPRIPRRISRSQVPARFGQSMLEKGFVGSAAVLAFKTKNWEPEARATNFSLSHPDFERF
jgi:hypothetical protein